MEGVLHRPLPQVWAARGHIDGTEDACPAGPTWSQPDAYICGWMYGSCDDTVLDLAMEPDQDARALYVSIEALF